jgi:hypothetical protein
MKIIAAARTFPSPGVSGAAELHQVNYADATTSAATSNTPPKRKCPAQPGIYEFPF